LKCRHCAAELSLPFLDLGTAPPSNAYLTCAELRRAESFYPLRLLVCTVCWLVQTEDYAGREALFTDDYAYFSSVSSSWLSHAEHYVEEMVNRFALGQNSTVVEVAANDGYLLQFVSRRGISCYGIEPTLSTASAAEAKGIEIVRQFFDVELAGELAAAGRVGDLMIANNVLAHVPDINAFVQAFTRLLRRSGVVTFEFPHLLQMVRHGQFDTAYHEHYSYLSFSTVVRILEKNGLEVFDVAELPTHGGSLRVFAQRSDTGRHPVSSAVPQLLRAEASAGMCTPAFYETFQLEAERIKDDLMAFLLDAKRNGLRVVAYGAAAKGNTLLNFAGVRSDLIEYVVDRNDMKQGKYLPGSRIPVVGEAQLRQKRPDMILVLPWNLMSEIVQQLDYVRAWGVRFVTAVPRLTMV
jgi:SAM-dependent methyltransferase